MENGRCRRLKDLVSRHHYWSVLVFILLVKILIWTWSLAVAHWVPVTPLRYFSGGHHYQIDPRITEHRVDFLSIWIYSDSEWYLSVAERGYPDTEGMKKAAAAQAARIGYPYTFSPGDPVAKHRKYTEWDADAKYAFFPLYPLTIALFHLLLPLHLAAFVATNTLSALAFLLLYALVFEYFADKGLAFRSLVLLVFYPFSVFYQAYFTEGLFLLLAVLSFYLLKKGRLGLAVASGALLAATKATGVLITIPLLILVIKQSAPAPDRAARRAEKLKRKTARIGPINWSRCGTACLVPLGLASYAFFNRWNTGYWDYFSRALGRWGYQSTEVFDNALTNIFVTGSRLFRLKLFTYGECVVEYAVMVIFLALIVLSYRRLPLELWSFSLLVWLAPIISKDLVSFSRYMSVSFPMFIYLAGIRRRLVFGILCACFVAGSLLTGGMMVTWHWVG
jgi:hypothetical protein